MIPVHPFWRAWPIGYQRLLSALMLVFAASLALAVLHFLQYPAPTYVWEQWQELLRVPIALREFESGGVVLTVPGETYALLEQWSPDTFAFRVDGLYLYLIFYAAGLCLAMAVVTALPRIFFLAGATAVLFIIGSLQLEGLAMVGFGNKLPTIILMTAWLAMAAYFHYFNKNANFLQRLFAVFLLLAAASLAVRFLSTERYALSMVAVRSLPSALVIVVLVILIVSHEIIAAFLYLIGSGRYEHSLRHFLIISLGYLGILWMIYWNRIGWIQTGVVIPPFVILMISSLLALWGFRQRMNEWKPSLGEPLTVYLLIALCTMCFSAIGYIYTASLDTALRSTEDLILYAHIGFGTMFVVYIASNFLGPISMNMPVYKVVYRPTAMPYFSYLLAGFIFTTGFVLYNRWMVPLNHFRSAWYTSLGDVAARRGEILLSMGYYRLGHELAPYNQHAATALATLEAARGNPWEEKKLLKDANRYLPTEFTLINEAKSFADHHQSLQELITLQAAAGVIPSSGIIHNDLSLSFARLGLSDSALHHLVLAAADDRTRVSAELNLLGLWAQQKEYVDPDSVRKQLQHNHPHVDVNLLALANINRKRASMDQLWPEDSLLNIFMATRIGNLLINSGRETDTATLNFAIHLARLPRNASFKQLILVPAAHAAYATGQVNRAVNLLQELIFEGTEQGKNNTTLALWMLEQRKPGPASSFITYAVQQRGQGAARLAALIASQLNNEDIARQGWDSLRRNPVDGALANRFINILNATEAGFGTLTDDEKCGYLITRGLLLDSAKYLAMAKTIREPNRRARAILERSQKYFDDDEPVASIRFYQQLQGIALTDESLFMEIRRFELRLLASQGQWDDLRKGVASQSVTATPSEIAYYNGLIHWSARDSVQAGPQLAWVATENPWFDEGVVMAARYFQQHGTDRRLPYRLLSEALQVNPYSVRILKEYIPVAIASGYDQYAAGAWITLRQLIPDHAILTYRTEKQLPPDLFP